MDERRTPRGTFTPPLRLRDATRSRSRGRGRMRSPEENRASRRRRSRSRQSKGRRSRLTTSRSRSRSQRSRRTSLRSHRDRRSRTRSRTPVRSETRRAESRRSSRPRASRLRTPSHEATRRGRESDNNLFIENFMNALRSMNNSSDRDKFPVLNNVIPDFDPLCKEQTVDTWLHKVDECAQIYGWSDKQIVHYALPKLSGVAKSWYQGLPSLLFSWSEWKVKLKESFPTRDNYADLLTEMLNKRVRYGESLEIYYYAKMNLLNRCEISGKRAVDCIIAGIEDRGVRLGAQGAEFTEPELVLKFLKTVKVDRSTNEQLKGKDRDKRSQNNSFSSSKIGLNPQKQYGSSMVCYNCKETGHLFFRCTKPKVQCSKCNLLGHKDTECPGTKQSTHDKPKTILQVENTGDSSAKYRMPIKVNGLFSECLVDLGSEGTLVRLSEAQRLSLNWTVGEVPLLRGIGNVPYKPLGKANVTIEVQGVIENNVEILVVDDYLINCPILLGHTYTERPSVKIVKTESDVIFQRVSEDVVTVYPLSCVEETRIKSGELGAIIVSSRNSFSGKVYVNGTVRNIIGHEHYLLPGEYQLTGGTGRVLIQNISHNDLVIKKGSLITRSRTVIGSLEVQRLDISDHSPSSESSINCGEKLTDQQKESLIVLLDKYKSCFSSGLKDLGFTTETEMVIQLDDPDPVVYRPYRLSFTERQLVQDMINEMLDSGIIRESNSPYASPIVLVNKKSGEKRLCVDYRALNRKTKKEHYPLPRIEDQLDLLSGSSLFITLDLASGYYQIPIADCSREKTAFVTPQGQYEYNRMPFGLVNAPSVFQRTMNKIIQNSPASSYALVYMDDILIPAKSFDEGMIRLEEVLRLLAKSGLTLKMSKCYYFYDKIDYLGYEVSLEGVRPGSLKTEAISKFPTPTNVHEVRRFLGLASFFRRFVAGFALIARPLTSLLKKDHPWRWGSEELESFDKLKQILVQRPVLGLYDPNAQTQLHTDASKYGVAGILMQQDDSGVFKPIAYYSRQTSSDEQKMHSFELETLAIISSLNRFRHYLLGIKFTIVTDCNALRTTLSKRDLVPRIARWWLQFLEFDCSIEYRPGDKMAHVDALSRGAIDGSSDVEHVLDVLSVDSKNVEQLLNVLVIGSDDWLATVQQTDEDIKNIADTLSDSKCKDAVDIFKNYKLVNGRVYRIIDENTIRWVVPSGTRWQLLQANHDDVGHFGFDKTLARLQSTYWFPKMRRFVKKYVSACLKCAHHKLPSGVGPGELHPIPKASIPFHTIHADHLGPFIRTKRGNTYILVIVDAFTKFVDITAVRNTKSATSIRVFREHFSYFGVPTRLITDQGTSFTSGKFKAFTQSCGIKHVLNAVATPRANGQVERYNRTILAALGAMNHDKPNGLWDEHLPNIQLGINTTVHATTKKTPAELLFGRNLTNPSEGLLSDIINEVTPDIEENLDDMRASAGELIKTQQNKDKTRYDRYRKMGIRFKEGDLVRVIRAATGIEGQSKKLEPKCKGPYRIKKVLPNDRFVVEDTPLTKTNKRYEAIVAIDKIFPWVSFNFEEPVSTGCESARNDSESECGDL